MVDWARLAHGFVSLSVGCLVADCDGNTAGTCDLFADATRCPDLTSLQVGPDRAEVGGSVAVTAVVTGGVAGETPVLSWSALSGTFADVSAPITTFTCTVPGRVTVTVTATEQGCTETMSASVDCVRAADGAVD
jgi:hypothetical protein